jgi:hypothetical protein
MRADAMLLLIASPLTVYPVGTVHVGVPEIVASRLAVEMALAVHTTEPSVTVPAATFGHLTGAVPVSPAVVHSISKPAMPGMRTRSVNP